ncbi:MAG: zf-HC2 domain-containing protein [Candidatus Zixiibacteriota bacterium]|nr:MAG: zf-HC2 domain-containing protein [candidate division Zixibacteria bacterium]
MICEQVQAGIPDFLRGYSTGQRNREIENHLETCRACQEWLLTWEGLCRLGQEYLAWPATVDWEPFDVALEAERHIHPLGGEKAGNPPRPSA